MAWSNGNKRWTIPFVSLNGTECRVDIYKRGYTGSTVTTLTADANPFEYNENADEDLLNEVIRYRTGYIRIREAMYEDLVEIYPSLNTDRYVEFYYGDVLDFNGYIQAQAFENQWVDGRPIELPVISPIGLAAGTTLDYQDFNPPSFKTIRTLIMTALGELDGDYSGYLFPVYLQTQQSLDLVQFLYLNSLAVCPFDSSYDKTTRNIARVYDPKTVEDLLTMICTGFGLILHDAPDKPIFMRMDYDGDYCQWDQAQGRSKVEQGVTDLTSIATVASARNTDSVVMPLSKIDVTYDGSTQLPEMTFDRCRADQGGCGLEDKEFCTNNPQIATGENVGEFSGTFATGYQTVDNDGLIDPNEVILGAFGQGGLTEMIVFRPAANDAWGTGHLVATYKIYDWDGQSARLQFKHEYGESIEELDNPEGSDGFAVLGVVIKTGNYYWHPTNGWQTIPSTLSYSKTWSDGSKDCEVGFSTEIQGTPQPLVVEFYAADNNTSDWIHTISDVKLTRYQTASAAYLNKNADRNTKTIYGSPSDESGSVTRGCSIDAPTLNRLRYNSADFPGTAENELRNKEPNYPYLLTAQQRLQIDLRMSWQTPATIHLNRMKVWGNASRRWRVVARAFDPWNDVYTLTVHHSDIYDY